MIENNISVPFRETIKDAPEFAEFLEVNTILGVERWPMSEAVDSESADKIVFVAKSTPSELTPSRMKISYESTHGLRARRMVLERRASEEDYTMECAEIRFSLGDFEIAYATHLKSPIVIQKFLEEPRDFITSIYVISKNNNNIPPLAVVSYDPAAKIQIDTRFPNADFEKMLIGDFDKREKGRFSPSSHSETYSQWEYLVGAKVGVSRYIDPEHPDWLRFHAWPTTLNSREPKVIEGTPYEGKITRSLWSHPMQSHRIRFSRLNKEAGQSIMFSVPDSIDPYRFHNNIQYEPLADFLIEYPAVFCVKNRGQERKWYSTGRKTDKE